ncbi:hypothetical protein EPN28_04930 [Patescibacteria group bacterium]|nr:MAG: hypothetical protein EPN28_04930 [Patescibacteria group bacterium]
MKKFAQINLTVNILKQASRYIVYSPALDLSTSGRSEVEAKKRFGEAAMLLIEELDRAGTLNDVLRELGWRHAQKQWLPPKIVSQEAVGVRVPVAA